MEIKLAEILSNSHIPLSLSKMKNSTALWVNSKFLESAPQKERRKVFCDLFSYAIKDSPLLKGIEFDRLDIALAYCERYGGSGTGGNGGGARVANIGNYQLKGVGPNCLVDFKSPEHHSYGGLDIFCAANEVIHTYLINKIMPVGATEIHGILKVGQNTGIYGAAPCCGVILVRERSIRPAHLLHAREFQPKKNFLLSYKSEEYRIKHLYKQINRSIGGKEFIKFIARYLFSCSNQFAFSKMARILNGGVTESNMCLNGKWIDVPLVGFTPGGKNWSQQSDFYYEHIYPISFLFECFHNYYKYTGVKLNPNPLMDYYNTSFEKFKIDHCCFLLGLNNKQIRTLGENENLNKICKIIESFIVTNNAESIKKYPDSSNSDLLAIEIQNSWISIMSCEKKRCTTTNLDILFFSALKELHLADVNNIKAIFIQSIKRLFLSSFFYLYNSIISAEIALKFDDDHACQKYISTKIELIEWIYEFDSFSFSTILKIKGLDIWWDAEKGVYFVLEGNSKSEFANAALAFSYLKELNGYISLSELVVVKYLDFVFRQLADYESSLCT